MKYVKYMIWQQKISIFKIKNVFNFLNNIIHFNSSVNLYNKFDSATFL